MDFQKTQCLDVFVIEPKVYRDQRGFFTETYNKKTFKKNGVPFEFVQDNHSHSSLGVLRGLHYQIQHAQGKLVRAVAGTIFDVAVDLRRDSKTFGHWVGALLSAENQQMLWVPPGFAHGYYVLSEQADVLYKTTDYYHPDDERCIRWDDPELNIEWPIPEGKSPLLSEKDSKGNSFKNAEVYP